MARQLIQIVSPAHNEAENVPDLVRQIAAAMEPLADRYAWQLILVDDGSTDDTAAVAAGLADAHPVRILRLSRPFGHQQAIKAGLDQADADAVIIMDSDLQHPPAAIPRFLAAFEDGANIVYTRYRIPADSARMRFKNVWAKAFYWCHNHLAESPLIPGSNDFRLIDRHVLEAFREFREPDLFLRGLFPWMGFKATGIEVDLVPRQAGEPSYSFRRSLRLAVTALVAFSTAPLRLPLWLALASLAGGVGGGIVYALWVLGGGEFGWGPTLVFVLLTLGGAHLLCLAIIGEYLGRVYRAQQGRPLYLVAERIGFDDNP